MKNLSIMAFFVLTLGLGARFANACAAAAPETAALTVVALQDDHGSKGQLSADSASVTDASAAASAKRKNDDNKVWAERWIRLNSHGRGTI